MFFFFLYIPYYGIPFRMKNKNFVNINTFTWIYSVLTFNKSYYCQKLLNVYNLFWIIYWCTYIHLCMTYLYRHFVTYLQYIILFEKITIFYRLQKLFSKLQIKYNYNFEIFSEKMIKHVMLCYSNSFEI